MGTLFFLVSRNWLLGFGGNEFLLFLILIFVSLLPDIDEKHSKVNRWSGIIGRFVIHVFKHRGILHSIFFFGAVALVLSWLFGEAYGVAVLLGYFAHVLADGITPMGIKLFYPFPWKFSGPMKVGSLVEKLLTLILFLAVLLLFYRIYF